PTRPGSPSRPRKGPGKGEKQGSSSSTSSDSFPASTSSSSKDDDVAPGRLVAQAQEPRQDIGRAPGCGARVPLRGTSIRGEDAARGEGITATEPGPLTARFDA